MSRKEIIRLIRNAEKGNAEAYNKLMSYSEKTMRKANQRLRRLESDTRRGSAYSRAINYTSKKYGTSRFRKQKSFNAIKEQLFEMETFLNSKTSTLKGLHSYEKSILNSFRSRGIEIERGKEDIFFDFLNSDFFNEFKKYDSDRALEEGADAILNGKTISDLDTAYSAYQKGRTSLIESWEEWVKIK